MKKKKRLFLVLGAVVVAGAAAAAVLLGRARSSAAGGPVKSAQQASGDLVIQKSEVSSTPSFYPYEADGTKMEVLAVRAPDGSVRTAFNTCQVCYSSGRGYYRLEGDTLVCQNCGNRFTADQVERQRGGCNPVGITREYKTETDGTITMKKDFFEQTRQIFANWKS
jgi:hypothetical protein